MASLRVLLRKAATKIVQKRIVCARTLSRAGAGLKGSEGWTCLRVFFMACVRLHTLVPLHCGA